MLALPSEAEKTSCLVKARSISRMYQRLQPVERLGFGGTKNPALYPKPSTLYPKPYKLEAAKQQRPNGAKQLAPVNTGGEVMPWDGFRSWVWGLQA